jgi:hypothetical protein
LKCRVLGNPNVYVEVTALQASFKGAQSKQIAIPTERVSNMKVLSLSDCELVSGGFRINPRSPVDCVPFEDVERDDAMSLHGIRGLGALPFDATFAPVAAPIAFAKPNPQVSGAAADHSAKGSVDLRANRPAEFGSGRIAER